jgi:acyl-CoA synthetase (AMP-forming)/AMP-acid ligase II
VIKTGGENVYATEIEDIILTLPYVVECSVIGMPDNYWGEAVVAFVKTNEVKSEEQLRKDLKMKLSGYKVPKRVIFVNNLPRNAVGKVSREELVRLYEKSVH